MKYVKPFIHFIYFLAIILVALDVRYSLERMRGVAISSKVKTDILISGLTYGNYQLRKLVESSHKIEAMAQQSVKSGFTIRRLIVSNEESVLLAAGASIESVASSHRTEKILEQIKIGQQWDRAPEGEVAGVRELKDFRQVADERSE
jgi:hypothetical protein